mgnify:FL=1
MTLIDIHFFIVDQVFHIAIERHIHFDLTMPVAGGHDMRCAKLNLHPLVLRIQRQRAAGLFFVAAAHKRICIHGWLSFLEYQNYGRSEGG